VAFDVLVAVAMLLLVLAVGITGHRRGRRPVERFAASRDVHWLPLGASLAASSISADTPLLIAGAVYGGKLVLVGQCAGSARDTILLLTPLAA
jgi:Na+/proline symporter